MLSDLKWYSFNTIFPRLPLIFLSSDLWIAVAVGLIGAYWGADVVPSTTTTATVSVAFLTYASIALGFSLAGLTLALTLPNDGFVRLLSSNRPKKKRHDSYSDLLFVFSWTAVIHWVFVIVTVGLVLFVKPEQPAFEAGRHRLVSGLVTGFSVYCLLQFLITLITLAQVGSVYIDHLQGKLTPKQESPVTSERA